MTNLMSELASAVRIDGERLWQRLMAMAAIGATAKGGCNRQALTDLDKQGRELFMGWCEAAGCGLRVDRMGNIFACRQGANNALAPVITGSHLDTQPTGGKFDGVYGVLAGLEVIETLNQLNIVTQHPLEVVVWTNEEGARFSPAMVGSGVWAGAFSEAYGHAAVDKNGASIGGELERIGFLGAVEAVAGPVHAAFELHIEQGPILEQQGQQIGIVTGVQGIRWYDVTLTGQACHAGPTPMASRRDPFMALGPIVEALYTLVESHGPWARVTFGDIKAMPGARNTVPEVLVLCVDLRHPDESILAQMHGQFVELVERISVASQIHQNINQIWHSQAVAFAPQCIDAVQTAVNQLGYSHMQLVSGAGHDAVYVSRVAPTSMIFIPCAGGISHNEAENVDPADVTAGVNVLLQAMLQQAQIYDYKE